MADTVLSLLRYPSPERRMSVPPVSLRFELGLKEAQAIAGALSLPDIEQTSKLSYSGDQHSKRNWISLKWGQVVVDRLIAFLGGLL